MNKPNHLTIPEYLSQSIAATDLPTFMGFVLVMQGYGGLLMRHLLLQP